VPTDCFLGLLKPLELSGQNQPAPFGTILE
jgi:hypothetical protein